MELAVAGIALGSALLFAGGSPAAPHRPDAQAAWSSRALPALTRIVTDVAALGDASSPAAPAATDIGRDAATLRRDLAVAGELGPPPAPALRAEWDAALVRITSVVASSDATVAAAGTPAYEAQLAGLRSAIAGAGDALLRLAGGLR